MKNTGRGRKKTLKKLVSCAFQLLRQAAQGRTKPIYDGEKTNSEKNKGPPGGMRRDTTRPDWHKGYVKRDQFFPHERRLSLGGKESSFEINYVGVFHFREVKGTGRRNSQHAERSVRVNIIKEAGGIKLNASEQTSRVHSTGAIMR